MEITFWGTRGSIAVPGKHTILYGGNTTCLEVELEKGETVIIDAGTGIRSLGEAFTARKGAAPDLLLITHVHWDHILGFPFFATALRPGTELLVDGHPNAMMGLQHTFDNPMGGGYFPVNIEDLEIHIKQINTIATRTLELGDTVIDGIPIRHPQGGLGFRLREAAGDVVFITDNELGGTEALEDYVRFCKGADVLIHDAQYAPEELPAHQGWGHSDYVTALELAQRAEVDRLVLFHHDPSRTDAELKAFELLCRDLVRKRGWDVKVEAAQEGGVVRVGVKEPERP